MLQPRGERPGRPRAADSKKHIPEAEASVGLRQIRAVDSIDAYFEGADASEATRYERELDPEGRIHGRARMMAAMIDNILMDGHYLDDRVKTACRRAKVEVDSPEGIAVKERVQVLMDRTIDYFVRMPLDPHGKEKFNEVPPVVRIAEVLEYVDSEHDRSEQERIEYEVAIKGYLEEVLELAFEQHWQNPEQYVSHDFSHSMRTAEFAMDIAAAFAETGELRDSPIIGSMMEKYGITSGEAMLLLYHSNMCHDCGYVHLKGRHKSVHAMAGAELQARDKLVDSLKGLVTSPDADLDALVHDMQQSIFMHGADVPAKKFQIRVYTDRGTFLTTAENLEQAVRGLSEPGGSEIGKARRIERIEFAEDIVDTTELEEAVAAVAPDAFIDQVRQNFFIGRTTDLQINGDKVLGLEYTETTPFDNPMLALLRLADNLDLTKERLISVKQHPAYLEIIRLMGDDRWPTSAHTRQLEDWQRSEEGDVEMIRDYVQVAQRRLIELYGDHAMDADSSIDGINSISSAIEWFRNRTIAAVLDHPKWGDIPHIDDLDANASATTVTYERIKEVADLAYSEDLKHEASCLSVDALKLIPEPGGKIRFEVYVNDLFDDMRDIKLEEEGYVGRGRKAIQRTNVAEYKLWRLEEAIRTNGFEDVIIGPYMYYADGTPVRSVDD